MFENFDFSRVGQVQSLLEANGIRTFLKNQFSSSVMGEVPFVEVCPQLFILDDADLDRARRLLPADPPASGPGHAWTCSRCGESIEGQFSECWNCANAEGG